MYRILMAKNFNQHPPPPNSSLPFVYRKTTHQKTFPRPSHPSCSVFCGYARAFFSLFFFSLTSPHLNLIEFVCAANGSPNDTLIQPVKGDECLHALAAQSMLVIIFLIWWIPPHPALPGNEIISHFDN